MLKRAIIGGLNAAGLNVLDLEMASVPLTRFVVRRPYAAGGLTVRLVEGDPQSVVIRFFDENGLDLSEDAQRKIERLFSREEFRQVFPAEIGDIGFPPRALEHYAAAINETVDVVRIRDRRFKLVVDYAFGSTAMAMPTVLAKLGADVLALNPYASTAGVMGFERTAAAGEVGQLVRASGADLGAVISPDGERLTVVDDKGRMLDDTASMLGFLTLVGPHIDGDRVAVPVTATDRVGDVLRPHGVQVERTKVTSSALLEVASEPGVGFAANGAGGFVLPGLVPAFDAAAALIKLLEMLAVGGGALSEMVDRLPPVHMAHETVVTPWEQKGSVMRSLVERSSEHDLELVDGVKVRYPDGWVLALPDPEEPLTHVWAEGDAAERAQQLAQEYARRIRQMVR